MKSAYRYMLDTNAVSILIRGHDSAALQALLIERKACVSVITEAEIRFGVKRKPEASRLAMAVNIFLQDMVCLPWTSATAETYADLRTHMAIQGFGLSATDLLIASHALAENCTLLSADRAFARVPGLSLLDWSNPGNN